MNLRNFPFILLLVSIVRATAAPLGGDKAIEHLKTTGQYDSLSAAITGAHYAARTAGDTDTKAFAQNPAHGINSTFTPAGLKFEVRTGEIVHRVAWHLESIGYGPAQAVVPEGRLAVAGQRVDLRRDSLELTEWFHNAPSGLEHGFTLSKRPAANPHHESLRLVLAVTGDLSPRVDLAGEKLLLRNSAGQTVLTYEKLKVWDVTGAVMPATMQVADGKVTLSVNEANARYPLTIDPTFVQQAYVKASNTEANDFFGYSVAISGDTVVVGAYTEDSNATGVNGNQADNSASSSGAAYIFVRSGTTWTQQAYLKASNTEANDNFGFSVAISGDTAVVGAFGEDSNATGVNGNQGDNSLSFAGAAYIFVRTGTTWSQQAYLKASNTGANDRFGTTVTVSGDTTLIGAPGEASNATGVNGDQTDNSLNFAGAAYVFVRSGTTWSQQAYLKASNTGTAFDQFGTAVAISGDTAVVGALEDSNATGVNGDGSNDLAADSGAAYVFVRSGTTWSQQAYLKASNTEANDQFGKSVAVSGDTVVVGAYREDSSSTGINGNQSDNSATDSGAAYVFVRNGTTWSQQAYLKASNPEANDNFGWSVAVAGDTLVVGAYGEDSNAIGVNGTQTDNSALSSGAAYVFARSGTTWSQLAYLKASNAEANDNFSFSVALAGDTVVVGAYGEDSTATGVNGTQSDNDTVGSGAVYVFSLLPSAPTINASSLTTLSSGVFQFATTNTDAYTFSVLGTTNLLLPSASWTVLGVATNMGGGVHQFADTNAPTVPFRFYQLRYP